MDMNQVLAAELNVKPWQVEAAFKYGNICG